MNDHHENVVLDTVIQFYLDETRQQANRQHSDLDVLDNKLRDINSNAGLIATIAASVTGAAITVVYTADPSTKLGLPWGSVLSLTLAAATYLVIVFITMIGLMPTKYKTTAPNTWNEVNDVLTLWNRPGTPISDNDMKRDFYRSAIHAYIQTIASNKTIVDSKTQKIKLASLLLRALPVFILIATGIAIASNAH